MKGALHLFSHFLPALQPYQASTPHVCLFMTHPTPDPVMMQGADFYSDASEDEAEYGEERCGTEGGLAAGGVPKRRRRRRRTHSKRTTATSEAGAAQLPAAPCADNLAAAAAAVAHAISGQRLRIGSEGGERPIAPPAPGLLLHGTDKPPAAVLSAAALAARRVSKKDYASWAAATPSFRAEAVSKFTPSTGGGAPTASNPTALALAAAREASANGMSPPRQAGSPSCPTGMCDDASPASAGQRRTRGTREGVPLAPGGAEPHQHHSSSNAVSNSRVPDSDGGRGFGMGRGRAMLA